MKVKEIYPSGNMMWFNDFIQIGDDIYFATCNFNSLYKYSLVENKLEWLGMIGCKKRYKPALYGKIIRVSNILYIIPQYAEEMGIYDLETKKMKTIPLPEKICKSQYGPKFFNAQVYNDKMYLFPGYTPYILEFDIKNDKWIIHSEWYNEYCKNITINSELVFHYDMVKIGNNIYLPASYGNRIFRFDMEKCEYEFIDLSAIGQGLLTLTYDNQYFWACTSDNFLLKIEMSGKIIDKFNINKMYGVNSNAYQMDFLDGYVYIFFDKESKYIKIDVKNIKDNYEIVKYDKEKEYSHYEYGCVNFVKKVEGTIFFFSRADRKIYTIKNGEYELFCEGILMDDEYSNSKINTEIYYNEQSDNLIFYEGTDTRDSINFLLQCCDVKRSSL